MAPNAATIGSELRVISTSREEYLGVVGKVVGISMDGVDLLLINTGLAEYSVGFTWKQVQLASLPYRPEVKAAVKDQHLLDAFKDGAGVLSPEHRLTLEQVINNLLQPHGVPEETREMVLSVFDAWLRERARRTGPESAHIITAIADVVFTI